MAVPWSMATIRAIFLPVLLLHNVWIASAAMNLDVNSLCTWSPDVTLEKIPLEVVLIIITASVKDASKALADSCMAFYDGDRPGGIPGLLPPSAIGNYNWWQSGALWGQVSCCYCRRFEERLIIVIDD